MRAWNNSLIFALFFLLCLLGRVGFSQSLNYDPDTLNVVVWNFKIKLDSFDYLRHAMADAFEEQLVERQFFKVLERRDHADLWKILVKEQGVEDLRQIPDSTRLKVTNFSGANAFIIGIIESVPGTPQINIRAKLTSSTSDIYESKHVTISDVANISHPDSMHYYARRLVSNMFPYTRKPPPTISLAVPGLHSYMRGEYKTSYKFLAGYATWGVAMFLINERYNNLLTEQSKQIDESRAISIYETAKDWQFAGRIVFFSGLASLYVYQMFFDYPDWKSRQFQSSNALGYNVIPTNDGFILCITKSF